MGTGRSKHGRRIRGKLQLTPGLVLAPVRSHEVGADGWLSDAQMRDFNTAQIRQTTALVNGRWSGSYDEKVGGASGAWHEPQDWEGWSTHDSNRGKASEKLVVPSFDGEASGDSDVGRTARSYVRKVQVWLRCTRMPPVQRALALYNELSGRAWVYAEELDVDILASENGVSYYLEWIQTRFMEIEITKVSNMMNDLFKKCRRRQDQSVRDSRPWPWETPWLWSSLKQAT